MKVAFAEDNVQGSQGIRESAGFKINASAHAFKILSSGLYSDKVRAVLREIGCNAQDAHIVAGTPDRPIRVKIPNQLDKAFYVQDWGPGLSHDDVMNLYSTYFASTKQSTNDLTGAFGLGSKSPFAYTDSFSVVSTFGGRKRTYTIYLDNRGAPTTSLMAEEDPDKDWASGLRVGFAVQVKDFAEFEAKAQGVYQWFACTPEIRGSRAVVPVAYKEKADKFWLAESSAFTSSVPIVLMGSVAYPLDLAQLGVSEDEDTNANDGGSKWNWLEYLKYMKGLVVPVPIGSVQVNAGRESLQYDPESVKFLKGWGKDIVQTTGRKVIELLEATEKGGWPAICEASTRIDNLLTGSMSWEFVRLGMKLGLDKKRAEQFQSYIRRSDLPIPGHAVNYSGLKLVKGTRLRVWSVNGSLLHTGQKALLDIDPSTAIAWGKESFAGPRAKRAVKEGKYNQLLVVCRDKDHKSADLDELKDDAKNLSVALGDMPLIELHTLEVPEFTKTAGKRRKKGKGWVPTLDASVVVRADNEAGTTTKKLGEIPPVMMCHIPKSGWGHSKMRVYNTTSDEDTSFEAGKWDEVFRTYCTLAKSLKVPKITTEYARISAREIKAYYLKELGWTSMYDEIRGFLQRKDVRDALRARVTKWRPVLNEYVYNTGWMNRLAVYVWKKCGKVVPTSMAGALPKDVLQLLQDILDETASVGKRATHGVVPEELTQYRALTAFFAVRDDDAQIEMKDSVTMEDMDQAFVKRFPRAAGVDPDDFFTYMEADVKDAFELFKFILSKESR